jgi:hypothetical protein
MMMKLSTTDLYSDRNDANLPPPPPLSSQSRHGGYLSYNNCSDIKASAPKIVPSARFVVWNCDDLNDHGIMRYGDAVWLQVSDAE